MSEIAAFSPPCPLHTPVLFLVYKRPDTTRQVFEAIRQAKPPRLYVAADGPKKDIPGEAEKVKQVRDIVLNGVDWDCEVKTLFREENLGCKYGVSGGIDWFFETEEEGIILEDDTLPSQSFFWFCQELLGKYRDDERVGHIGGTNPIPNLSNDSSYFFSKYNRIWGWASWNRAWKEFDVEIKCWPVVKKEKILQSVFTKKVARNYEKIFSAVYKREIDTWDYQWFLARLLKYKAIIPSVNLVANIGFGENATHTLKKNHYLSNLKTSDVKFPMTEPLFMIENFKHDIKWEEMMLSSTNSILKKIIRRIIT